MKMTEQEFNKYLVAFKNEINNEEYNDIRLQAISWIINGTLWTSKRYDDIPNYMKWSLGRKVARYIAQTALKSIEAIDNLAFNAGFHEAENGEMKSFATY